MNLMSVSMFDPITVRAAPDVDQRFKHLKLALVADRLLKKALFPERFVKLACTDERFVVLHVIADTLIKEAVSLKMYVRHALVQFRLDITPFCELRLVINAPIMLEIFDKLLFVCARPEKRTLTLLSFKTFARLRFVWLRLAVKTFTVLETFARLRFVWLRLAVKTFTVLETFARLRFV